ncbi:MAG: protein kinase domain-containing protein, partial [Gemmatimonadaceae bacterium]
QHAGGTRMTQTGMSLGTPQYMSPEQAMGERDVDHRADIYALAAVTYEMLTGEPPFSGPTAQAIVAKVMTNDPVPLRELRKTIPPHVEAAVLTGLQKLPADRFATAGDLRAALTDPRSDAGVRAAAATQPAAGALVQRKWLLPAAALALVALGAAAAWIAKPGPALGRPPVQFALYIDSTHQAGTACCGYQVAISPDERELVYVGMHNGTRQLYSRQLNELAAHAIPGTEGALEVFFSPDGNWLGFRTRRGAGGGRGAIGDYELRKIPARGGSPLTIATVQGFPFGATWLSDGTIVFAGDGNLYAVSADGGTPTEIGVPDSSYRHPSSVAGTSDVLYARFRPDGGPRVGVLDVRSGTEHFITDGGRPVYSADGYLTVARGGTLVTQSYEPRRGATSGSPRTLTDNLSRPIDYDISARGMLIYQSGTAGGAIDFVENGVGREITIPVNANHYDSPRISPDGRRLAVAMGGIAGGHQIVIHDLERNTTLRLTFSGNNEFLAWTPDGRSLVYGADSLVKIQPADRSAPERVLLSVSPRRVYQVSVGGRWLAYAAQDPSDASTSDIFIASLDSSRAQPYQVTPFSEMAPALSPDGKWLAYVSYESGRAEVYASAVPVAGAREVISNNGGQEPVWSRDGKTLFYRTLEGVVVAVSITGQASPTVAGRREIFRSSHELSESGTDYDVLPDGKGLVMVRSARAGAPIVVFTDVFSDIFRAAP